MKPAILIGLFLLLSGCYIHITKDGHTFSSFSKQDDSSQKRETLWYDPQTKDTLQKSPESYEQLMYDSTSKNSTILPISKTESTVHDTVGIFPKNNLAGSLKAQNPPSLDSIRTQEPSDLVLARQSNIAAKQAKRENKKERQRAKIEEKKERQQAKIEKQRESLERQRELKTQLAQIKPGLKTIPAFVISDAAKNDALMPYINEKTLQIRGMIKWIMPSGSTSSIVLYEGIVCRFDNSTSFAGLQPYDYVIIQGHIPFSMPNIADGVPVLNNCVIVPP